MPDQRMTGLFGLSPSTADVRDILSTIPVRKGGVLPLTEYGDGTSRLDWTAGIPGSLWDAFTAPARAYRGEIPEDQMIPEGLNFAGSVALGSAAVPRGRAAVASDRYRPVPSAEDVSYTYPAMPTRGGFTDEPMVNPFPGHARAVMDAETGGMLWPFDLTERATQRASGARAAPDLWSNPKESAVPGTVLSSASHLDMSPEARMARAREMGFDTETPYYHGTGRDVEAFDLSKARDLEGRRRGLGNGAGKVYLDPNPETAGRWAMEAPRRNLGSDPNVMPLYVRGELADDAVWQDAFKRLSGGRPSYDPALGMKERDGIIKRVDAELQGQGFSGIQTRYRNPDGSVAEIGQTAVFDPTNIRSVNAAFDPAKSSSANLLAANPETSAAPGLGLMAAAKQEPKGFIAYHGSPHDFDRFDISRIGTGEGVQAYGHGLYAADSPAVADSYRGAGNRGEWNYDPSIKRTLAEQEALSWLGSPAAQGTTNIRDLPQLARFGREPDLPWIKALDDLIARGEISRPGRLYQVRINADPDHFLDWDKPLSQQSEAVRKVDDAYWAKHPNGIPDASYFLKSQEGAQAMRDAGIPGIKYLDQGSRAAGNGSRNYVVFDDKLIDILKKYGLFGSLGMGAASMMSGGEANAAPAPKASPLWALQPGVF